MKGDATTTDTVPPSKLSRPARVVRALSVGTLAMSCLLAATLWGVSDRTWWGTVFSYLPKQFLLGPPALLFAIALGIHRRAAIVNLATAAIVAGPLMGGRLPLTSPFAGRAPGGEITFVSCNVQRFHPDFEAVLREMRDLEPDVVALQEAPWVDERIDRYFSGWHFVHQAEYWVGSKYPVQPIELHCSVSYRRPVALCVRIDAPGGPVALYDVHLTTARHGISSLSWSSIVDGTGPKIVTEQTERRLTEARAARDFVTGGDRSLPTVIMGDFNAPTFTRLYRCVWADFANAFDERGCGFGYTALCLEHRDWPENVAWLRIDHILTDDKWTVASCGVGSEKGSDHHLIWAVLARR